MRRNFFFSLILLSLGTAQHSSAQPTNALLEAIRSNDVKLVKDLVKSKADANAVDEDGDNALMYAVFYSTTDCLNFLLEKGANPNQLNNLGENALLWSVNDFAKAKILLAHHADPNIKTTKGSTSLLSACVGNNQNDIIKLLLENGADATIRNARGLTTLMQVALFGDTSIASMLAGSGVDINAQTNEKETALMFAVKTVNRPMINWLLGHGANADLQDAYKATALSYAVVLNDVDMLRPLLAKTHAINQPDIDGMTYLMWAVYSEYDNPDIVGALLRTGAKPDLKDKKGATALDWALKKGNTKSVALLRNAESAK